MMTGRGGYRRLVAIFAILISLSTTYQSGTTPTVRAESPAPLQACSSTSGYWYPDPEEGYPGSKFTIYGDGTQVNGGWYQGLVVTFDFQDSAGKWSSLGSTVVLCKDGRPALAREFTVPSDASPGLGWIRSTHNSIETCCMPFWVLSPPGGRWIKPAPNFVVTGDSLQLEAEAWPGEDGPPISYVKFTAFFDYTWHEIATVYPTSGSRVFKYTWTDSTHVKLSSVPWGPLRLSFDLYSTAGVLLHRPDGYRDGAMKRPDYAFLDTLKLPWCATDTDLEPRRVSGDWIGHKAAGFALDFTHAKGGEFVRGTSVLTPVGGTITRRTAHDYGNYVDIDPGNGWILRLAHLEGPFPDITNGKWYPVGTEVGKLGMTGEGLTGPHIHFEALLVEGNVDKEKVERIFGHERHFFLDTKHNDLFTTNRSCTTATPPPPISHIASAMEATWGYSDHAVAEGRVSRTWMWGPESFTGMVTEPYDQGSAPNAASVDAGRQLSVGGAEGQRWVTYYDKSRMEVTHPEGDSNSIWYVTNGLLVNELVSGQMQIGDSQFDIRAPADVNIAGDPGEHPTYFDINNLGLRAAPATPVGSPIILWVTPAGGITGTYGTPPVTVTAAERVTVPGIDHTVASVFWEFMNSTGTVYEDGQYIQAPLFQSPYYATGYPITEAYWSQVKIGGTPTTVLWQCFERRCLTYNPANPVGWQVEAGNVGRHYYEWRYASPTAVTPEAPAAVETCRSYDPDSLQIVDLGIQGWALMSGDWRIALLDNEADARIARAVARSATGHCFIGDRNRKDNWGTEYWTGGTPQDLALLGNDCLDYFPLALRVENEGNGQWLLTAGVSRMAIFNSEEAAQAAWSMARNHNSHCFIGRDNDRPNRMEYIVEFWK